MQATLVRAALGLGLAASAQLTLAAAPAPASAASVPVATVRMAPVASGFEMDGVVQAVRQATVAAQASGRVASLSVKAGDAVRAGQVLATIDDRETQTGVQRSQAQVAQAQAELRNAQAHYERTRDLQAKGFVSQAALDTADSQFKAAKAGADQAGAAASQAQLAQGFTRVTAPFAGWVQQTLVEAGDLAVPGKPVAVVYAPQPLRAVVQLPVSRADAARGAATVEVQISDAKGQTRWVQPTAQQVLPLADAVAQTVEWRLDLPAQASSGAVPGQQVRVRFVLGQAQRTVIPAQAVLRRGELTAVYVVQGEAFVLKQVRLGADHGAAGVEVLAGLLVNDRVALDPVRAGMAGAKP